MLAIIPASGGSKGLPGKNIRPMCGKPLINYTIEEALKAKYITKVIISTDSQEIAEVAVGAGAEVPFLRPAEPAEDRSLAIDTYIYTCERLEKESGQSITEFMVLQPTSPLRTAEDIDNAALLYKYKKADSVISVAESAHPVEWYKKIDNDGVLRAYSDCQNQKLQNRQELLKAYLPNGAIFIFNYLFLKKYRSYYSDNTYPYSMPSERSVDIDTLLDFEFAEYLMLKRR